MKVLVINWRDIKNPEAGGAEIHIDEILKRKPADWQVDFVSASFPGAPGEEDINGYRVIRIPNNFLFNYTFRFYWKTRFRKQGYGLIIDDISKIPLITPVYIKNIPILAIHHHIHGKSMFKELPFPVAMYVYRSEKYYLKFYKNTTTIVMADSNKKELEKQYGYRKVVISPTGMEYEFIREHSSKIKTPTPTMVYFGRLKKYKRVDSVIRAFAQVKVRVPGVKLWIAGKGDQEDALKELVTQLGLEQDVVFYGLVDDMKKIELLSKAWLYVIASEKEGWGLTVIEANSAGMPTVGFDVEGLRDSIRDGQTGFLAENGNINDLADKAARVLLDKELRDRMGKNAVEWASNFSWENTAKDFYRIAGEVLKNS